MGKNKNKSQKPSTSVESKPALKVSETASDEMTQALLLKRAVKRFNDANNNFTDREFFLDMGARSEASTDGKSTVGAGDILKLHRILLGEDKAAIVEHFNNDAALVDSFVESIMSNVSVKKA